MALNGSNELKQMKTIYNCVVNRGSRTAGELVNMTLFARAAPLKLSRFKRGR